MHFRITDLRPIELLAGGIIMLSIGPHSKKIIATFIGFSSVAFFAFQNCSKVSFVSTSEQAALKQNPFSLGFDANGRVDGVLGSDGMPVDNLNLDLSALNSNQIQFTKDCSAPVKLNDGSFLSRKEYERRLVLDEVKKDTTGKLIPVNYAISFGDKMDVLADWAHRRAILSKSNPGFSYIPTGPKNDSVTEFGYYKANHDKAKADFIKGDRCFFNTVRLDERVPANGTYYKFVTDGDNKGEYHTIHYMYYGWCDSTIAACATDKSRYGAGNYGNDEYPNRLFGAWPHSEQISGSNTSEPQFVKLYVADIRGPQMGRGLGSPLLIKESATRGEEKSLDVKDMINLSLVYQDIGQIIRNLASDYQVPGGANFSGMDGAPQFLTNLFGSIHRTYIPENGGSSTNIGVLNNGGSGTTGINVNNRNPANDQDLGSEASFTNIASQYTPIVLDLGKKKVRTSSKFGGTFFNMAALQQTDVAGEESFNVKHMTAWVGGDLTDVNAKIHDGARFKYDYRRIADDGFLVVTDSDGKVRSSKNLFGDNFEVNGETFENGFLALQALANKSCVSNDVADRYFGPWDKELYTNKIKVWIDANRNGEVDPGEIQSLESVGVLAINTCNIVHQELHDKFGNGTSLRSAFLYRSADDLEIPTQDEIINRLKTGMTSKNKEADFRLAIDLIFKVDESRTLKNYGNLVRPAPRPAKQPAQVAPAATNSTAPATISNGVSVKAHGVFTK